MQIAIDTHAHVFDLGLPMAEGRRYTPVRAATLPEYLRHLDDNGLPHGVLVQPSFLGVDNSHLLACVAASRGRLRGIVVIDVDTPAEEINRLDELGAAGCRFNLLGASSLPDLRSARWRGFLARVSAKNWQVELHCRPPALLELIPPLIDANCAAVIDHFGLPDPALGAGDADWRAVLRLGRSGSLWAKVSAPYRCGPHGRELARACYTVLRDELGAHRLMWGSDWPHTQFESTETYAGNRSFLDELVTDPSERSTVLGSAASLFGFT